MVGIGFLAVDGDGDAVMLDVVATANAEQQGPSTSEHTQPHDDDDDEPSLVHSLPTEILIAILSNAVETPEFGEYASYWRRPKPRGCQSVDIDRGPWPLSRVCTKWRDIMLCLPAVWSTVILDLREEIVPNNLLRLIQLQLSRSQRHSLHISVCMPSLWSDFRFAMHKRVFNLLTAESSRWHSVHFLLNSSFLPNLAAIRAPKGGGLPRLERLSLKLHYLSPLEASMITVFQDAPRLTQLFIHGENTMEAESLFFPWHQLTHLQLTRCKTGGLSPTLSACRKLEKLSLYWAQTELTDIYTLTDITSLDLRGSIAVTQNLTLPMLEELSLSEIGEEGRTTSSNNANGNNNSNTTNNNNNNNNANDDGEPPIISTLSSFLARSDCRITKLRLVRMSRDVVNILRTLSSPPLLIAPHPSSPSSSSSYTYSYARLNAEDYHRHHYQPQPLEHLEIRFYAKHLDWIYPDVLDILDCLGGGGGEGEEGGGGGADEGGERNRSGVCCPHLRTLTIELPRLSNQAYVPQMAESLIGVVRSRIRGVSRGLPGEQGGLGEEGARGGEGKGKLKRVTIHDPYHVFGDGSEALEKLHRTVVENGSRFEDLVRIYHS